MTCCRPRVNLLPYGAGKLLKTSGIMGKNQPDEVILKRFYETASVVAAEGTHNGFHVALDGRVIKSPAKRDLILPNAALAAAIADEWQAQGAKIIPASMAMMTLAATAVDRVTPQRAEVIEMIAAYGGTDLICYRVTEPADLVARQQCQWQPLLEGVHAHHGARLAVADSLMPVTQSAPALAAIRAAISSYNDFELAPLHTLTATAGSVIIALAVLANHIDGATAFALSQLDESYQIERWGLDDDAKQRREGIYATIENAAKFVQILRD